MRFPLMPFSIFRVRTVAGANVTGLLLGAVTFSNFFMLTLYVQQVLHYSVLKTGITFVGHGRERGCFAGVAQALVTKLGPKPVLVVGFLAWIAGMLWYTQLPAHASFAADLLPGYLFVGFALPFTFIPVSIAALAGVEAHEAGLASGLINTSQQIGGAIGVAVASSVSISHFNSQLAAGASFAEAFTSGEQLGVLGDGGRRGRRPDRHRRADQAATSSRPSAAPRPPPRRRGGRRRTTTLRAWRASTRPCST